MIGTGLAGFGEGLVQGLQSGQQMKMNQQKLQMQQAEAEQIQKFNALKLQEQEMRIKDMQKRMVNDDLNEAIYVAYRFGDKAPLMNLGKKYPNVFGDQELRGVADEDIVSFDPQADGSGAGLNPQVRNQWTEQTGLPLPEDDKEAIEYIKKTGMVINDPKTGEKRFTTPITLAASQGSKYRQYEQTRDMEYYKLLEQKRRAMGSGEKLTETQKDTNRFKELYANKDNLNEGEQLELRALQDKLKITDDVAKKQVFGEQANKVETQLDSGQVVADDDVNVLIQAQKDYLGSDKHAPQYEEYQKQTDTAIKFTNTYKQIDDITSKYTDSMGMAPGWEQESKKLMGQKNWSSMSKKEQEEALAHTLLNTSIYGRMFAEIKEQSGSAFSEKELAERVAMMAGGDPQKVNAQTIKMAFGTYTKQKIDDAKISVKNMNNMYAGDKASLWNNLNKGTQGFAAPTVSGMSKEPQGQPVAPEKAIEAEVKAQTEMAARVGSGAAKGIWDATTENAANTVNKGFEKVKKQTKDILNSVVSSATKPDGSVDTTKVEQKLNSGENPYLAYDVQQLSNMIHTETDPVAKSAMIKAKYLRRACEEWKHPGSCKKLEEFRKAHR